MVKFYHENGMFAENCSKLVEKESFFQHTETMILKLKGREKDEGKT